MHCTDHVMLHIWQRVAAVVGGLVLGALATPCAAQYCAFVTNSADATAVIDTGEDQIAAHIRQGALTTGDLTPDGRFLYAAKLYESTIVVIDARTYDKVGEIALSGNPKLKDIAVSPDGRFAYVAFQAASGQDYGGGVAVIDTAQNKIATSVDVEYFPTRVAITPDSAFAYVTKGLFGGVAVIDTNSRAVVQRIAVGSYPEGIAITPSGDRVYVANSLSDSVSVIDVSTGSIASTIPFTHGSAPTNLAVSAELRRAYVAQLNTGELSVIDLDTNVVVGSIFLGDGSYPRHVAITPDGRRVYVTLAGYSAVAAIDTATNAVVATTTVGGQPGKILIGTIPGGCPVQTPTPTPSPVPNARLLTSGGDVAEVYDLDISDDGTVVAYTNLADLIAVETDGENRRQLNDGQRSGRACDHVRVNGDGTRVVATCTTFQTEPGKGGDAEMVLFTPGGPIAITNPSARPNFGPDISADGRTVVFTSTADYVGTNPDHHGEMFLWRENKPLRQVTKAGPNDDAVYSPQLSADGQRILFERSTYVYVPDNDNGATFAEGHLYLFDVHSGKTIQLTSADAYGWRLSRDGKWVVFESSADLVGTNQDARAQLYAQQIGGPLRQLTHNTDPRVFIGSYTLNADASRIALMLSVGPYGVGQMITPTGVHQLLGVPRDAQGLKFDATGEHLAFVAYTNIVGSPPYFFRSPQLYVLTLPSDPGPLIATATPTPSPTPTRAPTPTPGLCFGDCDDNGAVTVDELVKGVHIALDETTYAGCPRADSDGNRHVTIDELILALNASLYGCVRTQH
ncbi:MAG: PD40 domain-containing protein [Deltaproteobacteria bacterium]|nr:PD40 domain-containing protein [Deltaproteobacteria bacterium]MBI3387437.1 PD40 domain-containing protein [Deltaproteobacteria bacterium]